MEYYSFIEKHGRYKGCRKIDKLMRLQNKSVVKHLCIQICSMAYNIYRDV